MNPLGERFTIYHVFLHNTSKKAAIQHMCPKVARLIRRKPDENRSYGKTPKTLCSGGVNSNILDFDQSQT